MDFDSDENLTIRSSPRALLHGRIHTSSTDPLLVAELPAAAIRAVRAARPGAIETPGQERWVTSRRPLDALADDRAQRELACLVGGALGDAVGYRVEFKSLERIRRDHGPQGIRLADCDGALVASDDTQMTLFTLEGLSGALRRGGSRAPDAALLVDEIRKAYLDWLHTQEPGRRVPTFPLARHRSLLVQRAPGLTCLSALRRGGGGSPESPANDSKGCGGVMRTAPIGFLDGRFDDDAVFDAGLRAAALTHGHADGYLPGAAMALAVRALVQGGD